MNRAYLVDWAKTENPALIPTLEGMARLLAWMSLLAGVLMMVGVAMVAFAGPSAFPLVMAIGGSCSTAAATYECIRFKRAVVRLRNLSEASQ